jgi:uncharacterized protein
MLQIDINVLVYAARDDAGSDRRYASWLSGVVNSTDPFALSELVLSGFVRVMMHLRPQTPGLDLAGILAFTDLLRARPNCVLVRPGPRQ